MRVNDIHSPNLFRFRSIKVQEILINSQHHIHFFQLQHSKVLSANNATSRDNSSLFWVRPASQPGLWVERVQKPYLETFGITDMIKLFAVHTILPELVPTLMKALAHNFLVMWVSPCNHQLYKIPVLCESVSLLQLMYITEIVPWPLLKFTYTICFKIYVHGQS